MADFIILIGTIVWGPHMLIFLLGIGIYFTIRLRFIQIFGFSDAIKFLLSKIKISSRKQTAKGDLTSYEALMTSLGGVVGNGNIAGVATAIAIGGPGAIFWMWMSAIFGMANSFAETSLGAEGVRQLLYQLVLFENIGKFNLSSPELVTIARQDNEAAKLNPHMLIAVVAAEDLIFGQTRIWDAYTDESILKSHAFRTYREATAWLRDELEYDISLWPRKIRMEFP